MFILFFLMLLSIGSTSEPNKPISLTELKWKNRVVIYFPANDKQWENPSEEAITSIQERKILYWSYGSALETNFHTSLKEEEVQALKEQYKISDGDPFWLLIGLDGGVKIYKQELLDWTYIFRVIDSMPMRQSEIGKIR